MNGRPEKIPFVLGKGADTTFSLYVERVNVTGVIQSRPLVVTQGSSATWRCTGALQPEQNEGVSEGDIDSGLGGRPSACVNAEVI